MSVVFHSDDIGTNIGFYASYESLLQDEKDPGRFFLSFQPLVLLGVDTALRWTFCQLGARDLSVD